MRVDGMWSAEATPKAPCDESPHFLKSLWCLQNAYGCRACSLHRLETTLARVRIHLVWTRCVSSWDPSWMASSPCQRARWAACPLSTGSCASPRSLCARPHSPARALRVASAARACPACPHNRCRPRLRVRQRLERVLLGFYGLLRFDGVLHRRRISAHT